AEQGNQRYGVGATVHAAVSPERRIFITKRRQQKTAARRCRAAIVTVSASPRARVPGRQRGPDKEKPPGGGFLQLAVVHGQESAG
ncbi:MAG TPA: hypothetical protein VLF15_08010, partial [Pseudoxanthomonas sp.]|nr:hypothetical protein [Pseudoxanthomonas sp.]